ncbi:ACT domain-containing protein [Deinococcus multiflagellatus]|uniref:ACT domain-containing protein n=1 Tax=Deinococcus multiflagellatus TaxID=1656887 RepID=A0ABW1ZL46_9DEIO|nr:ACT domain-containing protein [Deinococcus multiflagellatus]MBZ9713462.1 ACT domain-containing protein [Deinococcus multiflagellatus]
MTPQTLSVLPGRYAVVQLPPDAPLPPLAGAFWSLTRTADELSLVCAEAEVPPGSTAADGWVAFKLHGPFPFHLTGILASVLNPLRDVEVGIFALSTFDTDYVLVKQAQQPEATAALRAAGHTVLEA